MFLEGYETFISAILASRVKIRVLNYDADLEIFTSGLQSPHFDRFLVDQKPRINVRFIRYFDILIAFHRILITFYKILITFYKII